MLNSKQRLHTLFYLFIFQELTLTELSDKLGRTKNTVVYHMKLLADSGLIVEKDIPVKGSIKPAKLYRINPEFFKTMFIPFENQTDLTKDEILKYSHQVFRWNALLFETIREFLNELREFYAFQEDSISDSDAALSFHQKIRTPRDLIPLSEKGFKEYMKNYQELIRKTELLLAEEDEKGENILRPYLAFHNMILPIKLLLEFRN